MDKCKPLPVTLYPVTVVRFLLMDPSKLSTEENPGSSHIADITVCVSVMTAPPKSVMTGGVTSGGGGIGGGGGLGAPNTRGLLSSTSQLNLSHSDTKTHPSHPVILPYTP